MEKRKCIKMAKLVNVIFWNKKDMEPKRLNHFEELYEYITKQRDQSELKLWLFPSLGFYCFKYPEFVEDVIRKYIIPDGLIVGDRKNILKKFIKDHINKSTEVAKYI